MTLNTVGIERALFFMLRGKYRNRGVDFRILRGIAKEVIGGYGFIGDTWHELPLPRPKTVYNTIRSDLYNNLKKRLQSSIYY